MTNKEKYRRLCASPSGLPLFLKDWWLDVVCANWDVVIVYNGDKIAGVWPYCIENKIGVSIYRNPVLTPYLCPYVFYPHDLKAAKRDNFEYETIAALYEQLPEVKVWSLSLLPEQQQVGFFKSKGFDITPRQTFLMPLQEEEDAIFARMHEDYRRNIRKAAKELTITHNPEQLAALWEYQKATLDKKEVRMHFTQEQLQQLFAACIAHNSTALWVVEKEGVTQAIGWLVWDDERAYYLAASKNPTVNDKRAMTALLWHAIKEAKQRGKKVFDFEGSMDKGVEKFFRNFGGERKLYLTLQKNDSLLWKMKEIIR